MSTVNPVQSTTYVLSTSNNPITFGSGTKIKVLNGGDGVDGGGTGFGFPSYNVTNAGYISASGQLSSGIRLHTDPDSTVANLAGGSIYGREFGVFIYIAGTVTNAGSIGGGSLIGVYGLDLTVINESGEASPAVDTGFSPNWERSPTTAAARSPQSARASTSSHSAARPRR